ncbi:RNase H family protein [Flavobacterium sp.]|jgi:ribonuclease HI|uniref:RNase H family protein n=1 Tax=Flavobacterium sp. TaxID=239 RepID=UPI0037C05BAC
MTDQSVNKQRCFFYTDGSVRPNPGYGGFGVFGFVYEVVPKPKNQKHPFKNNLFFSDEGISKQKGELPIQVHQVVEMVKAFSSRTCTNNEIELAASLAALQKAYSMDNIEKVTIYTDSNYIVKSFNEDLDDWGKNGWKRRDGRSIAHINEWMTLLNYKHHFLAAGIEIKIRWVKGHADDYGNIVADLLANIGSNAARYQLENNSVPFISEVLDKVSTYAEYKASYDNKDFIYHFKDLFFSSCVDNDVNYCFISNNEDERETGKRSNTSIFSANFGYVPKLITDIRQYYRNIPRNFTATCCLKLSKLEDRDVLRLTDMVNVAFLLRPFSNSRKNQFSVVGSDGVFLEENILDFPFIINITTLSTAMREFASLDPSELLIFDVTDRIVHDNKLLVTNKDKFVDFSDLTQGKIVFVQSLLVAVGYDIPSYLSLKRIEEEIRKVEIILHKHPDSNFYTLYTRIQMDNRVVYSLNVPNKFLGFPVQPGSTLSVSHF